MYRNKDVFLNHNLDDKQWPLNGPYYVFLRPTFGTTIDNLHLKNTK